MRRRCLLLIAILSLLPVVSFAQNDPFYSYGPYDSKFTKPESILGYGPGQQHTVFRDQEAVMSSLASKAGARVRVVNYGKSVQGRPLRIYITSSRENMDRLDEIQRDIAQLANPVPGRDYSAIIRRVPALVWINECIHGDETASFESAMWLFYNLVASKHASIEKALKDVVVIHNPVYNPDGHERYVVWYNSVAAGVPEDGAYEVNVPSLMRGRQNHYRFDMNRDRVSMSQDETRAETQEYMRWNPQVYVDQHGQVRGYFFPPAAKSVNANVDRARYEKWSMIFGKEAAAAFDKRGRTYFNREDYDFYGPMYLDTWATLQGAIGMTHETDGGRVLAEYRDDGSVLTLRHGVENHFDSAMAVIRSAAANKSDLLSDFLKFKLNGVTGKHAGKFQRVVVSPDDQEALARLAEQLTRHGISYTIAASGWKQSDAHNYWSGDSSSVSFKAGSLVVDMAQSRGQLAKILMELDTQFEPEFKTALDKNEPDAYGFYDMTAWSIILANGVNAWWCESAPPVTKGQPKAPSRSISVPSDAVGWLIEYSDSAAVLALHDLMAKGVRAQIATREFFAESQRIPRGTFVIFRDRNEPGTAELVRAVCAKRQVSVSPLTTSFAGTERYGAGSSAVQPLIKPKIGVIFGDSDWISGFGPFRYLMEREWNLPFVPLSASALNRDLRDYSCIVVPAGRAVNTAKLKEFAAGGGVVVSLGNDWAVSALLSGEFKREQFDRSMPGSLYRASLSDKSHLSYGYKFLELAVPVDGGSALKGSGAVSVAENSNGIQPLSGWTFADTPKKMSGTSWVLDERVGAGRAVIFLYDPTDRAMWQGHWKMILNAMILGPG